MDETELSRVANFSSPALVHSPPENNLISTLNWREWNEPPLDPVEALCQCQRRYREVQTEADEELFALTEAAYFLGKKLEQDCEALLRFIQQPLFQDRKVPLKPHHQLKPILLAVQFLRSASTENERKYASWLARALQGAVGEDPQPGDIHAVLCEHGFDKLAKTYAQSRQQATHGSDSTMRFTSEAHGPTADTLRDLKVGERVWLLAEHVPTKRGNFRLQFVATRASAPDD